VRVVYLPSNMFILCLSLSHHQVVHKKYKDDTLKLQVTDNQHLVRTLVTDCGT